MQIRPFKLDYIKVVVLILDKNNWKSQINSWVGDWG
jgi:hypothetical protein